MEPKQPYLILGLDPGIASCGFCLLDRNNQTILEMGSHLFKAPQEDKTKVSLAVIRRNARSARRNNQRTKMRMTHCLKLLADNGLIAENTEKPALQSRKGDKPLLKLRASGLDRLLTNREFAQVLYSLCGRRGYIPHGEGSLGETDDAEGKKVLNAIKENLTEMNEGHFRTVGEMLYKRGKSRNNSGSYDLCVYNSQIQDEVHALFKAQRNLGNLLASKEFEDNYTSCLTWQKSTLDNDARTYEEKVGMCSYFSEEKRAANADISSELCLGYERFGHLVIVHKDGSEQRLTSNQIEDYLGILFSSLPLKGNKMCKVTYGYIRKDLDLSAKSVFKGIAQDQERNEVFVPKSWRRLRETLPTPLLERMLNNRKLGDAICEALTFASSKESLSEKLADLDLSDEERTSISKLPFTGKLFKGYGKRSLKALNLLLDAFEEPEIHTLTDAEQASGLLGYRLKGESTRQTLLPPYSLYEKTCTNPVVLRAMGRMRRIVNAIIKIYGVPDEIHIELGRELKMSKKEKDLISKRNNQNQKINDKWTEHAAEVLGKNRDEISKRIIRKLVMREEQGEKDLYTGDPIDLERLIKDDRYCEIDHILPYSRTCDDSRNNKVLVLSAHNQNKRERTPYEWMTSGEPLAPRWESFYERVMVMVKNPRKRANLLNTNLDSDVQDKFLARNLNDDRYMSVAVKKYLEDCLDFPNDGRLRHVTAISGGATGNLRWVWGLNFGDDNTKDRSDDRHHAVDAAIIAACSEGTVRAVAKARALGHETFKRHRQSRLADTQPWQTFADEVEAYRESVVPTRMADHGVTGRLFEDTLYKIKGNKEDGYVEVQKKAEKPKTVGNFELIQNGSVRLIDGIAFLRLWLDPNARPNGKVKGKWYVEPVYFADMAAIKAGTYIPRAITIRMSRTKWEPVSDSALKSKPIVLFRGDVLEVDNHIARYWKINIHGQQLKMLNLITGEEVKDFPSVGKWGRDTHIQVLQEDCLGLCYKHLHINQTNSLFERQ